MKTRYILFSILFAALIGSWVQAQPVLKRYYPLNNGQGTETVGRYDGKFWTAPQVVEDRFGNTNGAVKMVVYNFLGTPSFVSDFDYKNTGLTLSFWIKNEDVVTKKNGTIPWDNSDYPVWTFFAMKDWDVSLLGMYRRRDRAVLDRYTTDTSNNLKNWGVWLWDPVNFTNIVGWYHVVISYEKSRTFIYLFYPNGKISSCVLYFGLQDLSAATKWGLGSPVENSFPMDDFKVYQGTVTETQAREMHAKEALPEGMYRISLCANNNEYVHSVGHLTASGTALEIFGLPQGHDAFVYKWVFEPVPGKLGVYMIRMAYEDVYMHIVGGSPGSGSRIELWTRQHAQDDEFEWYVESAGDGYFFISSNKDRTKLLHTVGHAHDNSARLEVWPYDSGYAPTFKWKLNLLKTNYEIENGPVVVGKKYMAVLSANTFLSMMPQTPISGDNTYVRVDRGPYPSYMQFWSFFRHKDDGYRLYNATYPEYNLCPHDYTMSVGINEIAAKLKSSYANCYDYVVDKPNKYGRRVLLRQALDQALCVTADAELQIDNVSLWRQSDNRPSLWALYRSDDVLTNKQPYDLKPGIYRIVSVIDDKKAITTSNFDWGVNTNIVMNTYTDTRYTSYYWIVDYERDASGKPVLDGTYTIQKFGTDKLYFYPKVHSAASNTKLELYPLNRDYIGVEKWFIRPTRTGDGAFLIQCAADPTKYVHLTGDVMSENTQLELLEHKEVTSNFYRWVFQPVSIIAPFDSQIQKVFTQKDQTKYLHVRENWAISGSRIDVRAYNSAYDQFYNWVFTKQEDNTYVIKNDDTQMFIHPVGHTSANGTRLEQLEYNSAYSPYYKWIIAPGSAAGTYRIYSVADPSKLIHLSSHTAAENNDVEILLYNSNYANTYEWKLK